MPDVQNEDGFILVTYETRKKVRYFYEKDVHSLEEAHDFSRWRNFDPSFSVTEERGKIVAFVALPHSPHSKGNPTFDVLKTLLLHDCHCELSDLIDDLVGVACKHHPHKPAP